ncbi:phosphatidylinositol-4- kinase [Tulasnella sp. 403]|nr:phosphatidylinositol-4- kinase [Tulasnella sp. 403]
MYERDRECASEVLSDELPVNNTPPRHWRVQSTLPFQVSTHLRETRPHNPVQSGGMPAFDPVRDAVANSPRTPSYALPSPSPLSSIHTPTPGTTISSSTAFPFPPQNPPSQSQSQPLPSPPILSHPPPPQRRTSNLSMLLNGVDEPPKKTQRLASLMSPAATEAPLPLSLPFLTGPSTERERRPGSSSSTGSQPHPLRTSFPGNDTDGDAGSVSSPSPSVSPSRPPPRLPSHSHPTHPAKPAAFTAPKLPYNPRRITPAASILRPLTAAEAATLVSQNPLRNFDRPGVRSGSGAGVESPLGKRSRDSQENYDVDGQPPPLKRSKDSGMVIQHYNARPDVGIEKRQDSPIIGLKSFNNWIKSVLISKFAVPACQSSPTFFNPNDPPPRRNASKGKVLDMGCGKGGDLQKWSKARIGAYVGVDIAALSVDQAYHRWVDMQSRKGAQGKFDGEFVTLDAYASPLSAVVPPRRLVTPFDVVSMQFCMHYAFETEAKVRMMLDNVTKYLRPGGVFIGTIPNDQLMLQHLAELPPNATDLSWGNGVYTIRFDNRTRSTYGQRYSFFLKDAVDNVPEYVVHWPEFEKLAKEYHLRLVYKQEFHQVFEENREHEEFAPLLQRMKVVDANGESHMDEDQWEAASQKSRKLTIPKLQNIADVCSISSLTSLEFNLHQLILTDLARSVACATKSCDAGSRTEEENLSINNAIDVLASRVETRVKSPQVNGDEDSTTITDTKTIRFGDFLGIEVEVEQEEETSGGEEEEEEELRVFMSASRVHCNIAFGELAHNVPQNHATNCITILVDILRDIPFIDFEYSLAWEDWALPDQLVFSTVSALLRITAEYPEQRRMVMEAIVTFSLQIMKQLESETPVEVITRVAPSFHGLYRAITSTPFPWNITEWRNLSTRVEGLFTTHLIDRLNSLLTEYLDMAADTDHGHDGQNGDTLAPPDATGGTASASGGTERAPPSQAFVSNLVLRYVAAERPLSGYFLVCSLTEIQWVLLGQVLAPPELPKIVAPEETPSPEPSQPLSRTNSSTSTSGDPTDDDAAAANDAWAHLMKEGVASVFSQAEGQEPTEDLEGVKEALRVALDSAMKCFEDLLGQIEEMDVEPSMETYAYETMAESLKLASLCCIALGELDSGLFVRLKLLLSDASPVYENLVQEAALTSTTVLVHNFPEIAGAMTTHLRRFVTAPLPIFELEFSSDIRSPPPLTAAAKCLALCIRVAPGDDLVMSNMYSLLNYIAATSKELSTSSSASSMIAGHSPYSYDHAGFTSVETGLKSFNEDQRRLIGISTISVVTHLALEFEEEEVTKLTVSMLLQRFRTAEQTVEAAIAYNLVDLALAAPTRVFADIVRSFSLVNRVADPNLPRFSNNMVLAAQTRLAQELHRRPELYETYLVELMTLFAERGIAVQTGAASSKERSPPLMDIEELGGLVLPIDALLSHKDFQPHVNTVPEVVALFRNFWFICVLFQFTAGDMSVMNDWQRAALARIATKTPPIVHEASQDFVTSELEYNPVLRQDYMQVAIGQHRNRLNAYLPQRAADIKYLSPGQIVFILMLHDVEVLRSHLDLPASLASYFVNEGLNRSGVLAGCMDAIAENVMTSFTSGLAAKILDHSLRPELSSELRQLLIASCHRVAKTRDLASKYLNRLLTGFPSLMCDAPLIFSILDVLTLLRKACEGEFTDEYTPQIEFYLDRTGTRLELTDNYVVRNEMLGLLHKNAESWLQLSVLRAPIEVQAILQSYIAQHENVVLLDSVELGPSLALKYAIAPGPFDRKAAPTSGISAWRPDHTKIFASQVATKSYYGGEAGGIRLANHTGDYDFQKRPPRHTPPRELRALKTNLVKAVNEIHDKTSTLSVQELKRLLVRCASFLISSPQVDYELLHYLVALPFEIFTPSSISIGIEAWTWLIREQPNVEISLMVEINSAWAGTIRRHKGIFSTSANYSDPFNHPIEYSPTDRSIIDRGLTSARRMLLPHMLLLAMLTSRFQAARYKNPGLMLLVLRLVLRSCEAHPILSTHPLARESRFSLLIFGFEALKSSRMDTYSEYRIRESLYKAAFSWFAVRPQWSYGANRVQIDADVKLLNAFLEAIQNDATRADHLISSLTAERHASRAPDYSARQKSLNNLLRLLVENEISRLNVWSNPTNDVRRGPDHVVAAERSYVDDSWNQVVRIAWRINPAVAIHLAERFKAPAVSLEISRLVRQNPQDVCHVPEAIRFFLGDRLSPMVVPDLKHLLCWSSVPPVVAINFFGPNYNNDPIVLQYAHRVLVQHPVDLTFFFVPQVVQALRHDALGYVERFIFETAKISQLFCHQIIWNMKANCYKDDAGEIEDSMKPMLDRMVDMVVASLSGEAREFYDREFGFFNEVTSISGKLKPYIKKTKPEKKAKIDEEMEKIVVDPGVYLPSNPDGVVVDIDKKSGRPLQSHAKAPFMATFKVRKERVEVSTDPDSVLDESGGGGERVTQYDVWQQAIFKVGDDCRQDVLALQIIAMFKNIFSSVGLMLYLFPYRVTATGPGCGVIDVVPNATSRDEMGRAKINDLLGFFVAKYGNADTLEFQKARLNFIQSMAAYSVACYILQIKDRHNGNIMIDGQGHIVHIDFGFLFDIDKCPGVKFEPSSFKLNHEMVVLMGGRGSQGYALFVHLTVKAFLAIRPHAEQLIQTVSLMLGTDFPSFKGEPTIKRLRDRFALGLTERQAADFMMGVVKNAHENMRSTVYDEFQRLQNGIPYA